VGGALGVSNKYAIGAAFSTTKMDNTIKANVDNSTVTSSGGDVSVLAGYLNPQSPIDLTHYDVPALPDDVDLSAQVIKVTVAGAGGDKFAAGGAISLNWLRNTVEASVTGGAKVRAYDDLTVQADAKGSMIDVAFGAAVGGSTLGAAIAYNFVGGNPGDP